MRASHRHARAEVVADEAAQLAAAWSGPSTPSSWALTATLFGTVRDDVELAAIAAEIAPEKLPALLFVAAMIFQITQERYEPLLGALPVAGAPQPPLPADMATRLRDFCLPRRDVLLELAARHRYQMSEPLRCAHLLPAVGLVAGAVRRPLALVDLGTGAGFALHIDRFAYAYHGPGHSVHHAGDRTGSVTLSTAVRGPSIHPYRPRFPPSARASGSIPSPSTSPTRACEPGCAHAYRPWPRRLRALRPPPMWWPRTRLA